MERLASRSVSGMTCTIGMTYVTDGAARFDDVLPVACRHTDCYSFTAFFLTTTDFTDFQTNDHFHMASNLYDVLGIDKNASPDESTYWIEMVGFPTLTVFSHPHCIRSP